MQSSRETVGNVGRKRVETGIEMEQKASRVTNRTGGWPASDWIRCPTSLHCRASSLHPGHSRSHFRAPIPTVHGGLHVTPSPMAAPTTRSRTNLFVSYRDSQARSSRFRTRRYDNDDDDNDDGEAQRLIRPENAALHIDVAPSW